MKRERERERERESKNDKKNKCESKRKQITFPLCLWQRNYPKLNVILKNSELKFSSTFNFFSCILKFIIFCFSRYGFNSLHFKKSFIVLSYGNPVRRIYETEQVMKSVSQIK